jgi:2-polyprenyl-6-methoxyphenol hydroxylase-like FAD-dependent oxidoreductase
MINWENLELAGRQTLGPDGEPTFNSNGTHALVLGGSLAGLMAARVLRDHYDRVTVIERDTYPTTPAPRRGVPQANHVHGLMVRGRLILEELFPGLQDEMVADGAPLLDLANEIAWLTPKGWGTRFESDLRVLSFTRPLLDHHVRKRMASEHRVQILENTEVVRLLSDKGNKGVKGAIIRTRHDESRNAPELHLSADLVVDATGRGSQAKRWLTELGHTPPAETVVDAHIGYASRFYRVPANFRSDWRCLILQAAPPDRKRGGIIFLVEGDRWLITLIGGGHDHPPTTEEGFLEFARSLESPLIYESIRNAEPLTPILGFKGTENRLRHFDRAGSLPENFIALGDSVCAFNPVYGQGMTIAAIGAITLRDCLQERKNGELGSTPFTVEFQRRLAKVNEAPWMMATSQDLRYRETIGASASVKTRFMHWYMDSVLRLASFDVQTREVLLRVFAMLIEPSALFQPRILLSSLGHALGFVRPTVQRRPGQLTERFRISSPENHPQRS